MDREWPMKGPSYSYRKYIHMILPLPIECPIPYLFRGLFTTKNHKQQRKNRGLGGPLLLCSLCLWLIQLVVENS